MKALTKFIAGAALAASAMASYASPITVGGVTWDPDYADDFFGTSTTLNQTIGPGGVLSGFGVVTTFNDTPVSSFCSGCELTFEYGGYTPFAVNNAVPIAGFNNQIIEYVGGWLRMYVDFTPDADASNSNLLTAANSANGTLWLDLAAHGLGENNITLIGTNKIVSNSTLEGSGLFDAVAGLAFGNFDTNTKNDGADLNFSTSFSRFTLVDIDPGPGVVQVPAFSRGTGNLSGNTIPEPATLALVGLGLLGAAVARKRANRA